MITYTDSLDSVTAERLTGFFVGWPKPPSTETHLKLLRGSSRVWLAIDADHGDRVVGFLTAMTDGVLCAYLPLLEVLPGYQGHGIAHELMERMLDDLKDMYVIDLVCDEKLQPFYEQFGMKPFSAMVVRNYDRQNGA